MAEYASKGVAGTGLGLGIAGTVALANQLIGGNGNNGLLGGGNNQNDFCNLRAENAMLKAEKYSDKSILDTYKQSVADNKELRAEMYAFIKPLSDEAADNRVEIAKLQGAVKCNAEKAELREQITAGKINEVALVTNGRFTALDQTINCINQKLDSVGRFHIMNDGLCPGWGPVCTQPVPCDKPCNKF